MFFGHQLHYAAKVLAAHRDPLDFGATEPGTVSRVDLARDYSRVIMQILVSLIILAVACFVLLSQKFDENLQKAAIGFIGTIVGYWLR